MSHWRSLSCLLALPLLLASCGNEATTSTRTPTRSIPASELTPVPELTAVPPRTEKAVVERDVPISPNLSTERDAGEASIRDADVHAVFRPDDTRAQHDLERAKACGIQRYQSRRLILYTDIDPAIAETLPPLIDELYERWVSYFGELPPNRQGTAYQMTGYLIREAARFREAGMLPDDLPHFEHGRHRGAEFWMNEQEYDYYRRHLLCHEATHCFMTTMPGLPPPLWYLEGMAEYFGTHRLAAGIRPEFGVWPDAPDDFVGFGRIEMIREEMAAGRSLSLHQVTQLDARAFIESLSVPYAWSWALCHFLESHPRYHDRFRQLGQHLTGQEFYRLLRESFASDLALLQIEWETFVKEICYGYDVPRNAMTLAQDYETKLPHTATVVANQGWQSTGFAVRKENRYRVDVQGTTALAQVPKPWTSYADGITIRYAHNAPIGRLQAAVWQFDTQGLPLPEFIAVGDGSQFIIHSDVDGYLFLRVNDFPDERDDNTGGYEVTISSASELDN